MQSANFPTFRRIKYYLKSTIKQEWLRKLVLMAIEQDPKLMQGERMNAIVEKHASSNERRL